MRSTFASRRLKARKIGQDADEEEPMNDSTTGSAGKTTEQSTVTNSSSDRPSRISSTSKPKKRATPRLSFGPSEGTETPGDDDNDDSPVFKQKKSALSRKAIEKNAARKARLAGGMGLENLNLTPMQERPSYSKEYLDELKSSTPKMPVNGERTEDGDEDMMVVDDGDAVVVPEEELGREVGGGGTVAKFGSNAPPNTSIPDEGIVRVLKARRAEKANARGRDFISLDDDGDDGNGEIILKSKKKESRLQKGDVFDDDEMEKYVEDERIILGGKAAQREQQRRRRQAIRDTIAEAEGGGNGDDSADSDISRDSLVEEWERDQIRKGAFSSSKGIEADLESLSKKPPNITPLPNLKDALERLENMLAAMEFRKAQTMRQVELLAHEKSEILEREEAVQTRLKTAGAAYEKLKEEVGMGGGGKGVVSRGLESFGSTPTRAGQEA